MVARFLSAAISVLGVPHVDAATLSVSGIGYGNMSIEMLIQNLMMTLMGTAYALCVAVFVGGAFFYIISLQQEKWKGLGKSMMIGAVVAAIVIAGAQGIMNTVLYFIYS
ncbi:hypothetical protein COU80_05585 [Candidatus Peregrinibacteria bacterium CG10_big_fil_rev_8_21_14_0_10_55_24]|nr:MAG: hypothetical protein COU80_05585 [Candidatus Peregrinibacteria bacterium CG10_big_fil_rev_8_21_14_0_10_55_24]